MTGKRRRFTAEFKKRVALDALRGDATVQALAAKHEVHPNQVSLWKKQAVEGLAEVFAAGRKADADEALVKELHAKIGELTMERDFFGAGWRAEPRRAFGDGRAGRRIELVAAVRAVARAFKSPTGMFSWRSGVNGHCLRAVLQSCEVSVVGD